MARTGPADGQRRVPLLVVLALALGTALQGVPIFALGGYNGPVLVHLLRLQPLLHPIPVLGEATVYLFAVRGSLAPRPLVCAQQERLAHQRVALVTGVQDRHPRDDLSYISTSMVPVEDRRRRRTH